MDDWVKYEWALRPPDFFRGKTEFEVHGYTFTASGGTVEADTTLEEHDNNIDQFELLTLYLRSYLRVIQLKEHKPYAVRKSRKKSKKGLTVYPPPAVEEESASIGYVVIVGTDGLIIPDHARQQEKIKNEQRAMIIADNQHNPILEGMLNSFDNACSNTANELIYLYEIRDAVAALFGGEKKAKLALGILDDWGKFGRLCNNEPMPQGRHRGKQIVKSTTAPPDSYASLAFARSFAREVILKYIEILKAGPKAGAR